MRDHPAFRELTNLIPLSGFSGAHVALLSPDSMKDSCVRKAAITPDASKKLRDQAYKLDKLSVALGGAARVPKVLRDGTIDDCYWFDMQFVPGMDAIQYLANGTRQKVDSLVNQIGQVLQVQSGISAAGRKEIDLHSQISKKLDEINQHTGGIHNERLAAIRNAISCDRLLLSPNLAHGDLTLENILIDQNEKIWLIDAITSPFDHYWIDLAKLFQDLVGRWFLHRGRTLSIGLVKTVAERILQQAIALNPRYLDYHHILLALNFARILPYCKCSEDTDFVVGRIDLALNSSLRIK